MDELYKDHLEGLLQARSEDMRLAVRRRRNRPAFTQVFEQVAVPQGVPSARSCETCGKQIAAGRLRAMPSATCCLSCRRSAERAGTPT